MTGNEEGLHWMAVGLSCAESNRRLAGDLPHLTAMCFRHVGGLGFLTARSHQNAYMGGQGSGETVQLTAFYGLTLKLDSITSMHSIAYQ